MNTYDQTQRLILSPEEKAAGHEIVSCINCEEGERRVMDTCQLCGGRGLIRVFNGDSFGKGKGGRKKKDED